MIAIRVSLVLVALVAIGGCKSAASSNALSGRWSVVAIDGSSVPDEKTVIQVDPKGVVTVVSFDETTMSGKATQREVSDFFRTFARPKDMTSNSYEPGAEIVHRIKGGAQLKYRKLSG